MEQRPRLMHSGLKVHRSVRSRMIKSLRYSSPLADIPSPLSLPRLSMPIREASEVTFKLYEQSPIGQDKEVLNNEISGAVGGMVYVVMEVKLGPGEKLASSSATVRIKDTWSGYENGLSRGWMDIPVDFTSSEWCEMVNQSNGGCDLTWTTAAPASTDNANGAMYRSFYMVIKEWNTPLEPYAEYYKQATDSWVHFDNPTVGHNGSHEISVVAVDEDTAQTALEFQHYDATANPPGWQDPVEVNVAKRSVTVSNLVVTNLSPVMERLITSNTIPTLMENAIALR